MANCKSGGLKKDAEICWIGHVSHHLRMLFNAIELVVLHAFTCKVGYFDAQIVRLYYTSRGFDLLASLAKCNQLSTGNKITKRHAFFIICSTPSLKKTPQISSYSFWPSQLISTVFFLITP